MIISCLVAAACVRLLRWSRRLTAVLAVCLLPSVAAAQFPPQYGPGSLTPPPGYSAAPRIAALPNTAAPAAAPQQMPADAATAGVDPADAEAAEAIPVRSLLQIFHEGGLMMYPIAIASFVVTVFAFERLLYLRGGRVIPRPFVKRLIEMLEQQQIDRDEAIELCQKNPSPIAEIISAAIRRYGRPAVDLEAAVMDTGERVTNAMRKNLRVLSAISNVSPLLGLLGTVLGMIEAFNEIASANAMGRPEMLAGGISEALLTTASGLLVAIPAYLTYVFFTGRIDRLVMEMDGYAQQVVDAISAEGLAEADGGRSRSRSRKAA
jgi:biopolymer transport protein ExbB